MDAERKQRPDADKPDDVINTEGLRCHLIVSSGDGVLGWRSLSRWPVSDDPDSVAGHVSD